MKHFVNAVVFDDTLNWVLLGRRNKDPFNGSLNFPGGSLLYAEDLEAGAKRELLEETSLNYLDLTCHGMRKRVTWYDEEQVEFTLSTVVFVYDGPIKQVGADSFHIPDKGFSDVKFFHIDGDSLLFTMGAMAMGDRGDIVSEIYNLRDWVKTKIK